MGVLRVFFVAFVFLLFSYGMYWLYLNKFELAVLLTFVLIVLVVFGLVAKKEGLI